MRTRIKLNMIGTIGYSIIFKSIISVLRDGDNSPSSLGSEMSGTKFKSSCHHGKHGRLDAYSCGSSPVQRSHSLKCRFGHRVEGNGCIASTVRSCACYNWVNGCHWMVNIHFKPYSWMRKPFRLRSLQERNPWEGMFRHSVSSNQLACG